MKVLVTGVAGQLGHDVICELLAQKIEVIGTDIVNTVPDLQVPYFPMDITNQASVSKAISEIQADAVIHCAAWTAVDAAEDPQNQAKVFAINEQGTKYIAQACKDTDTKMMYISTDYVFSRIANTMRRSIFTGKVNLPESKQSVLCWIIFLLFVLHGCLDYMEIIL